MNRIAKSIVFATHCCCAVLLSYALGRPDVLQAHSNAEVSIPAQQDPAPPAVPAWARRKDGTMAHTRDEHATPSTKQPPGLYVAIGDSITYGTGVKQSCGPFPTQPVDIEEYCPDGTSYAILTAKGLRKAGIAGSFMNVGIGGAHVEQTISEELPYLPANTTIVSVYLGTNDSRVVRKLTLPISEAVEQFEEQYEKLLSAIHAKAPQARIVLINFPNQKYLADPKRFGDDITPRFDATSQILDKFIDDHYPKYSVVDTICNPSTYDPAMIFEAGVHPNEAGAAVLAKSVLHEILSPAPPSESCQWFNSSKAGDLIHLP